MTTKHPLRSGLLLTLPCLAMSAHAAVLINLDATSLPLGALPAWANTGSVAGNFTATGAPAVASVGGVKAVTLAGNADFYEGPVAPASVTGVNPSRSIEVWAYNPSIAGEETLVAWGRRGGGDGTNIAFNYGADATFGAAGQWGGGPDIGWNPLGGAPLAGVWHHLVYTYDGGGVAGAGTCRVYSDGVLQNSEFQGNLNTHDGFPFVIGGQINETSLVPAGFNSGLSIAKVRVHDVALTGAQIAAQYAAELPQIYPAAYYTGSKVTSSSSFAFTLQDRPPASLTDPATFSVAVGGVRAGWQVAGGEGIINGSITSPAFTVPNAGPVEMSLRHRYNFEGDLYDGGVVQVSINDGEFVTLEASNFTQEGYAALPLIGHGVLDGVQGWNAGSNGFAAGTLITSIATIPAVVAGDTVKLRFLGAWDEGYTSEGIDWEIAGLTVKSGAATVLNQDFTGGDGGFTAESTAPNATWSYLVGTAPTLGTLGYTKTGEVTTFNLPINWAPGRTYDFTLSGKNTNGGNLVYTFSVIAPSLPLAVPRVWPATIPGPLGTAGAWGVRTFLNEGISPGDNINAMLDFLAASDDRTPALTPESVVDTQESTLNFVDPATNGAAGVVGCPRPFPGDALSTANNGGAGRDDNNVVTSAHASITIAEESDYTFNFRGDDGFMCRIVAATGPAPKFIAVGGGGQVDQDAQNIIFFPTGTGDVNTRGIIHLTPGVYNLEYATWEGGGGFWYQVSAAKGFHVNNADTNEWRAIGYNSTRTTPIPYPSIVGDWTVLSTPPSALIQTDISGADAAVNAAVAADPAGATSLWPQINFFDPQSGGQGRVPGDVPWPRNTDADDNKYAMRMSGTLRIPEDGDYLLGFQGDDGTRLTVGGINAGFTALTQNATGAGVIGRANTVLINSGSLGAAANFSATTSAGFQRPGALAGSADTAISVTATDGQRTRVPYLAALNPAPFQPQFVGSPVLNANTLNFAFTSKINDIYTLQTSTDLETWLDLSPDIIAASTTTSVNAPVNPLEPRNNYRVKGNPAGDFSAEIWVKPSTIPTGLTCALSSGNFGDPRSGWLVYMDPAAGWNFRGYINSGLSTAFNITAGEVPVADTWYHVVVSWESATGTASIFVNGTATASANGIRNFIPTSAPSAVHGNLNVGSRADGAFGWTGDADELAIYPTALNEATVQSHFANGTNAARPTPYETLVANSNPLGYWRMNEAVQPRVDLGTITTDVPTGDSSTIGRIFLTAGDYPISATFWEDGGGSYIELFGTRDTPGGCVPVQPLRTGGFPSIPDSSGLPLVAHP